MRYVSIISGLPNLVVKYSIRSIIIIGFSATVTLTFLLVFISLSQLKTINDSMSTLVQETNTKTDAAHDMRDAIRLRHDSFKKMQLMDDVFDRDEERLRMTDYAHKYRMAREKLVNTRLNAQERDIDERLTRATSIAKPVFDNAVDLLIDEAPLKEINDAMNKALLGQIQIMSLLDEMVILEKITSEQAVRNSNTHYQITRNTLFGLSGFTLLVAIIIATMVTRRAHEHDIEITHQASHDPLTGLLNRREFERSLRNAVENKTTSYIGHVLLYMDLDQFKVVNDTCGHAAGDQLLIQLTALLRDQIRTGDVLARLGGDEFGLLLENCPLQRAIIVGESIRKCVSDFRFSWLDHIFNVGISIGIVPIMTDENGPDKLLAAADTACYTAKDMGRNRIQVYDINDGQLQERRGEMKWIPRIENALENDRFELWFQPLMPISRNTSKLHIEVLLRMLDEDDQPVPPGAFLPAAERYSIATHIDQWVVKNSLDWLEQQQLTAAEITIAINLSGQSLNNDELLQTIIGRLTPVGRIQPTQICFEITETAAIANISNATAFMNELRGRGCKFALDDFGSGMASFGYLKTLPVDILKIDGSFVRGIADDPIDRAMVKSINELGHVMDKLTVAEFVENDAILEHLRAFGVDFAQGYGIAKPARLAELDTRHGNMSIAS